jgi:hypothetical protein
MRTVVCVVEIEFVCTFQWKSVFRNLKLIPFNFYGVVNKEVAYLNAVVDVMHAYSLQNCCIVELMDCILLDCFMVFSETCCLPLEKKIYVLTYSMEQSPS